MLMDNKSEVAPTGYEKQRSFDAPRFDGMNSQIPEQQILGGKLVDSRGVGNKALSLSGETQSADEQIVVTSDRADGVNYSAAPDARQEPIIKTTDTLDPRSVEAIDEVMSQLDKDGDVVSFYDKSRNYMEKNIDESFGRKIGDGYK